MHVLVVYDVSDGRLRRRLARLLLGYGERVQRSAFECVLGAAERRALESALRALVPTPAPAAGDPSLPSCSVRLYPLLRPGAVLELGHGRTVRDEPVVVA